MKGFDDLILSKIFYHTIKSHKYKNRSLSYKKKIYYCNSNKAFFILPEWMGDEFYFKSLINKLKTEYTIVFYYLPSRLLSDDIDLTINLFRKIVYNIKTTFDKLQKKGCKHYTIIGNSVSSVIAVMTANRDERCKKLILNLTGHDLAEGIWNSNNPITISIKNKLIDKGITLSKLKNHFNIMSYKNNSKNLKEKDILIFLSKNDKIIPYNHGNKLLKLLDYDDIKYELVENKLFGHYISGLKNILFNNKIINFLEKR